MKVLTARFPVFAPVYLAWPSKADSLVVEFCSKAEPWKMSRWEAHRPATRLLQPLSKGKLLIYGSGS